MGTESLAIVFRLAEQSLVSDLRYTAPTIALDHLSVKELSIDCPRAVALAGGLDPLPVGGQGMK
jgi:hypothetical protein